ncbi:MAG TPA: hypothetical protein VGQ30_14450 [Gemmatimonadaceae bacterium]|nr:hypothetical protein [Gemmatimonadaceae bacterium]
MSPQRSPDERRRVMLLAAGALLLSFACGEPFVRTNPYDPNVPVTITLDGPDTIFNSFEQVPYIAHADPPVFPDTAFFYQSSNPIFLEAAPGSFFPLLTTLYPAALAVTVTVGVGAIDTQPAFAGGGVGAAPHIIAFRHSVTKVIYLSQRIKHITLRCPDTHTCDPLAVGNTWSVWVDPTDSLGHEITAYFSPVKNNLTGDPLVTYSVRDPSIASVVPLGTRVGTVTALKPGTTWILGTRGPLVDSMQLVVH